MATEEQIDAIIHEHLFGEKASLPFFYSSDISAAFQVVEKMRELGWGFRCSDDFTGSTVVQGPWWAEFSIVGDGDGGQAYGASVPMVVCCAALKAVGVEVET